MRRFLTAFAAAVLVLSLGTANAAEYKKMTIRAATANPQGSLHVVAIDKFKEIVEKESNGAITVQTFYGGSLGDEQANVKQLRNAEIHLAVLADGNLTPFAPQAGVFILPYMFPKISDAEKLFSNEAFMKKTADAIAKQSRTRPLAWLAGGYRVITNSKKPITTMADLKGTLDAFASRLYGEGIRLTARQILLDAHAANNVNFQTDYNKRVEKIGAVVDGCSLLLEYLTICTEEGIISAKKAGIWTKKVTDVKYPAMKWLTSERGRAEKLRAEAERKRLTEQAAALKAVLYPEP